MSSVIVIAALVLNPIARRKRTARTSELVQVAEAPTFNVLTSDTGGSDSRDKSDLELGEKQVVGGNLAQVPSTY